MYTMSLYWILLCKYVNLQILCDYCIWLIYVTKTNKLIFNIKYSPKLVIVLWSKWSFKKYDIIGIIYYNMDFISRSWNCCSGTKTRGTNYNLWGFENPSLPPCYVIFIAHSNYLLPTFVFDLSVANHQFLNLKMCRINSCLSAAGPYYILMCCLDASNVWNVEKSLQPTSCSTPTRSFTWCAGHLSVKFVARFFTT